MPIKTKTSKKSAQKTAQLPYDEADHRLDEKIKALEAELVRLYFRRANRHVVSDWYWCACGKEKVLRAGAYAEHTRCSDRACVGVSYTREK